MQWQSIYHNGEILNQYENGVRTNSERIDRTQLKEFRLIGKDGNLVFVAFFDNTGRKKLIFRERTWVDGVGNLKGRVFLVGWHENVKGVSVKSICYVYDDGHIEFDDDRNDLELVPCEM